MYRKTSEDLRRLTRRMRELGLRHALTERELLALLEIIDSGRGIQPMHLSRGFESAQARRDIALAFSDHAQVLKDHERRLRALESRRDNENDLRNFVDPEIRGFKVLLEERLHVIEGILCVFAVSADNLEMFTVVVEDGLSVDLMERIVTEFVGVHEKFPEVAYDFEVEEIGLVNIEDYDEQELILDCRGVVHDQNAAVP
ncbi:MAG: hypothetical protein DRO87_03625 [Candidatus Thorarchaeota archaeon]|nr:MAG: hypothetical protein DRP09_05820 [Candidatus Thorarchaeota archaeon]RLI59214.1 MAG: hypothetical protein DRO87_03625 [Candidatus Thorarchaeota archaeon]